jgi:hypothetical protein
MDRQNGLVLELLKCLLQNYGEIHLHGNKEHMPNVRKGI